VKVKDLIANINKEQDEKRVGKNKGQSY